MNFSVRVEQHVRMLGGAGQNSYASNSKLQEKAILMAKPVVEKSIEEICKVLAPKKMVVADLGCSSGPNSLLFASDVIEAVRDRCQSMSCAPLEIQFFLNDLPGNDFNTLFSLLDEFEKQQKTKDVPYHYVAAAPGSFYGRLFPSESVHFFHSCYSLQWLSQIPQGLGVTSNKRNMYISETSPRDVVQAYRDQFQSDFSLFLRSRFAELCMGGFMVLTFLGRRKRTGGGFSRLLGLLAEALSDMASQGIIEEGKLEALNMPLYAASMEEVKQVIQSEGLFEILKEKSFESNWDPFDDSDEDEHVVDNLLSGKNVARSLRAVFESIVAHQLGLEVGNAVLDDLFSRFAVKVSRHLLKEKTKYTILNIALKKKV